MAINLNEEVSSRMDAYRANPGALQKRYQSNQELLDLLALQKLTAEKKKAQQELQAAMQQDPRTIKQQLEQEALGMTKDEMAQQLGGIGKTIQTQQQKNLQRAAAGVGQPKGLESLTPPNAPRTPQPTQPTARMAGGGIVSLASGGLTEASTDVLGKYRRDAAEKAYKKERDAVLAKLSQMAQPDEHGQLIPIAHRPENVYALAQRLDQLNEYIDARRRDYPGDFTTAPTDAAPTDAAPTAAPTAATTAAPTDAPTDAGYPIPVAPAGGAKPPALDGTRPNTPTDTTASAPTTSTTDATAGVPTTGPNINPQRTVVPQTDLSGIRQLMNAGPYGDGTSTRTSNLQEYGLAGLDKQAPVDQAQRQAAYDQRFGRADEAARYADFEKQLTALQDKRRAQDSDFFNKFMRFVGEATKGNSGGYGNFARAYIGGLDRESLRDRQDLMQVYELYKAGRARDSDLAKAATEAAAKDMELYLKIKEVTANAIANDKKLAVDWQRALLQAGVDMRQIASNEVMKQATLDAQREIAEFNQNSASYRSNRENIVKLYGDTSRLIAQAVSEITRRSADILRSNEESIGLDQNVRQLTPQQANALAVMSVGESGILDAIDSLQRIVASMGGEPMNFGGSTVNLSPDVIAALRNHPIAGKYVQEQQPK